MAHLIILLFFLYGVVHGEDVSSLALQECCQEGLYRGREGHDCAILPFITSHTCSIVREQCCQSVASVDFCDDGIKMARTQGACEMPFFQGEPCNTKISKMCCDCCTLGLMAAGYGLSCEFHGLSLGEQCTHSAQTCCGKNTTEGGKPTPAGTEKPAVVTTKPPEGTKNCTVSNCSQLCVGNGICACRDGFKLQKDGVTCEDVNECLTGSHNCVFGQVCINTNGSFRCQRETGCGTGYELTDNNHCQDIDECALGIHNCGPGFLCTNTEGSFRCLPKDRCTDGFIQDAVGSCIDIDECVAHISPCQPGQTCVNMIGSYTCRSNTVTCGRGYHLTEDGTRCEDVDECRTGNVCGHHGCVNLIGSYRCECQAGYKVSSITRQCEDINECRTWHGRPCAHKCENTEGSFKCSCSTGFKLAYDGRGCEDVNECEAKPCSQECANFYGSYQCYCRRGYQLSDIDGTTCEDIDECALSTGGHVCSYYCINTPGSFNCTCPPWGYTLAYDGRTCLDIDECAAGTHSCSVSQSCFNVPGGFRCLSFECPPNFQKTGPGTQVDAAVTVRCTKACQPHDATCFHSPVQLITHTALSLPPFRDLVQPEELVLLQTNAVAKEGPLPGRTDVSFVILAADDQLSFDVEKRTRDGMIVGVIRQVKPIIGPRDLVLEVAMDYSNSEFVSLRKVIVIHIFISHFWF